MLPVNTGGHSTYQNFVVENFRKYYPNPDALSRSTWDIIDRSNTGIRKELMPNAKPIAKNIMPTKARGTMKFFCEVFIIIG